MSGEPTDSAQRLHIAYYSPSWPPAGAANGIVTYVRAMRDELVRQGHCVSIVTLEGSFDWDRPDACRPLALSLPGRAWAKLLGRWDLVSQDTARSAYRVRKLFQALHRRHPIDIIEMEESFGWFAEAAKIGVPVVARLHGPHFRSPGFTRSARPGPWYVRRERREGRALASARAITAPSEIVLDETVERYGCEGAERRVIANPVPIAQAEERWAPEQAEPRTILWIGQFAAGKAPDVMLQAFEQVLETFPDVRLTMAGPDHGLETPRGSLKYQEYRAAFVKAEVAARVDFRGRVGPEELADLRRRSSLAVVTSKAETFCYVLAEALALGMPALSTPWAGLNELLNTNDAVLVTGDFAAPGVAEAIIALFNDPGRASGLAAAGWRAAKEAFADDVVADQSLRFYRQVIRATSTAASG